MKIFEWLIGSSNDRKLKKFNNIVAEINALEQDMSKQSDEFFANFAISMRERLKKGDSLDKILPETFAAVREASKRILGLRHYDVQLLGGLALHEGKIAEMATGEGKTLTATLPITLNALAGSVHVITVNDYLAERDSSWMGEIYKFLGLSVGHLKNRVNIAEKQEVYAKDIIYGTNSEFGFDYLRDRMALREDEVMQGKLTFAIIDEVDSILIDEARTPLIISGESQDDINLYVKMNRLVKSLRKQEYVEKIKNILIDSDDIPEDTGDFLTDEKNRSVFITDRGHEKIEGLLISEKLLKQEESLYDYKNSSLLHHINIAIKANYLFKRDVDYVVFEGKIVIIDEHTGRAMPGRRWSEGIHQAIEAREGVVVQRESQTLASTTFQNYFRLYKKIAGMTGTARTEAKEFHSIYGLDVLTIPTNKPKKRLDHNDFIYLTKLEKYEAILAQVKICQEKQQPVLIGTANIENSEILSNFLQKAGIVHQVLNAKQHERESHVIAQAGRPGMITIATNMAGRGTDIVLGGNIEAELKECVSAEEASELKKAWQINHDLVKSVGGLFVLGAERHESRRIDNQLIGRSGRQGDPGESRFYLSLEDDMIRIFASDKILTMMKNMGFEKGEVIEHRFINSAIERAQKKIENQNFDIRKQLVDFDDINNEQRRVLYTYREDVLYSSKVFENAREIASDFVIELVNTYQQEGFDLLFQELRELFDFQEGLSKYIVDEQFDRATLMIDLQAHLDKKFAEIKDSFGENIEFVLKAIFLRMIDKSWREHLTYMEVLRQGMHFRGYAQKDPKQEYKKESFMMFSNMIDKNNKEFIRAIIYTRSVQVANIESSDIKSTSTNEENIKDQPSTLASVVAQPQVSKGRIRPLEAKPQIPVMREAPKIGRNDPCYCGSGKKFKQCHGA